MNTNDAFYPRHILCPIDFSDLSNLALKYAAVGAKEFNASLTVLHAEAFEMPRYFSNSESGHLIKEFERAKQTIRKDLKAHTEKILGRFSDELSISYTVSEQPPAEAIITEIENNAHGMIVIGTHGLSGWKRFLLGSVTENIIRLSAVPVFTIRQKEHNFINSDHVEDVPKIERILCPCNKPDSALPSLKIAVSLAGRFNARLTVLYADDKDNVPDAKIADMKSLCAWLSDTVPSQCNLEPIVRRGNAAEEIIAQAKEGQDDMIVLGAIHKPFMESSFLGRTTELVLRNAPVPVLAAPHFIT